MSDGRRHVIARLSLLASVMFVSMFVLFAYVGIDLFNEVDPIRHPERLYSLHYDGDRHRSTPAEIIATIPFTLAGALYFGLQTIVIAWNRMEHVVVQNGRIVVNGLRRRVIDVSQVEAVEFARYSDKKTFGVHAPDHIEIWYRSPGSASESKVLRLNSALYMETAATMASNLRAADIDVLPRAGTIRD